MGTPLVTRLRPGVTLADAPVAAACGHLPLALRIAGPGWPMIPGCP